MRLSFSAVSTYQNCPLSYKFIYKDKKPIKKKPALSFGSSLHAALAKFYSVEIPKPPSLDDLLHHLSKNWKTEGYKDSSEEKLYYEHAKKVLNTFYQANIDNFRIPAAIEHKFQVELDGCTLAGIIDRMDKLESGGYEIIDYKTARKLPPQSRVDSDLQLSIYHLAAEKVWGIKPEKLTLYFLIPNQRMSTTREKSDIDRTKRLIHQTLENITAEKFDPQENALCPWCDFQPTCPVFRHKFVQEEELTKERQDAIEIEKVIEEYADLKREKDNIQEKMEELAETIHSYCERHSLSRLYSEKAIISRSTRLTPNYDVAKLKEILEPLGLWEQILKVDNRSLKNLLESNSVAEEIKNAIEQARDVENISYALYVKNLQEEP